MERDTPHEEERGDLEEDIESYNESMEWCTGYCLEKELRLYCFPYIKCDYIIM